MIKNNLESCCRCSIWKPLMSLYKTAIPFCIFLSSCLERFLVALSAMLHLHKTWKWFPCYWHEKFSLNIPSHHWKQGEQKLSICFLCSVRYFTYFFYIACFLRGELFLHVWLFLSLFNAALLETRLPTTLWVPGGPATLITFNHCFPSYSLWIPKPCSFFTCSTSWANVFCESFGKLAVLGPCKQGSSKTLQHPKIEAQILLDNPAFTIVGY